MFRTKDAWARSLRGLPPAELAKVHAEFATVHLSLNFEETAGTKDRSAAMSAIRKELMSLPSGYARPLFSSISLPARLHGVRVHRNKTTDGPHFSAPSTGSWMPPQLNKIERKLRDKNYTFSGPLELFAYSEHDEPHGHVDSLNEICACINGNLTESAFTRVHVFHLGFLRHIVTTP
jgi:hypothetical protein